MSSTLLPTDYKRLRGQCGAILALLREGPATNAQLAGIALKYTNRISDLRADGHVITCERMKAVGREGTHVYTLMEEATK